MVRGGGGPAAFLLPPWIPHVTWASVPSPSTSFYANDIDSPQNLLLNYSSSRDFGFKLFCWPIGRGRVFCAILYFDDGGHFAALTMVRILRARRSDDDDDSMGLMPKHVEDSQASFIVFISNDTNKKMKTP
jgi:hypothetical protein